MKNIGQAANVMCDIEFVESPESSLIDPIINGVIAYGKKQVAGNVPRKFAFLIKQEQTIIGGIVGAIQYDRFYLSHIWVTEELRDKGYGTKLLIHCESRMREMGCNSIILETLNEKAVRLYLKHGYSEVSRIQQYVKGFDLVHLLKAI